jgi:site-specific DNA recombinase
MINGSLKRPWMSPKRHALACHSFPKLPVVTSSRLRFDASAWAHGPGGDDGLSQRALKLGAGGDRLSRSLASIAERRSGKGQVVAGLVDEPTHDTEVDELADRVHASPPSDLEFGLRERWRALVLCYESFTIAGMRIRRVLGYARVSSEEQAKGSSLDDQQNSISSYAKSKGFSVTRFFVEAESAVHERIERREQIRLLMADIRAGDLVVCAKLDRWSRDPEFTYASVRKILGVGASFFAVDERCDPSTPDGDTALGFRILFAREEHKRIRERMVGTRKLLRDRGYYVEGLPPYGYRRAFPRGHKGANKNVLVVHDQEANTVRHAFALSAAGHSLSRIASTISLPLYKLARILRKRTYLGELRDSRGQWIRATHEAIVRPDVFAMAQLGLDSRRLGGAHPRGTPSQTSTWFLRDLAKCARCGARMSAAYAGKITHANYARQYYVCSHRCKPGGHIRVGNVEAAAEPLIVARLEELGEQLARDPKPDIASRPATDFSHKRAKLNSKRERYLEAFSEGLMSKEELRISLTKVDDHMLKIEAAEEASKRTSPLADKKIRRAILKEVGVIKRAWRSASPQARREIVGHLATAASMAQGKTLRFQWRSAEELAAPVLPAQ